VNPEKRTAREARMGIVGLLTLGLVRDLVVDEEGRKLRLYSITAAGREALKQVLRV
jgi:hypothetical protein